MEHITEYSLEHLATRISYLSAFLDLTTADANILQSAKPLIMPMIPYILDAVYTKLLSFDITAKIFVPKEMSPDGEPTLAHPMIVMRKDFLRSYLTRLLTTPSFDETSSFWTYLDKVAIMHTGQPSFKRRTHRPKLKVEYIHMGMLLGYVMNLLIDEIMALHGETVGAEWKRKVLKSLNKVLWMQNDLFARHYLACAAGLEGDEESVGSGSGDGGGEYGGEYSGGQQRRGRGI